MSEPSTADWAKAKELAWPVTHYFTAELALGQVAQHDPSCVGCERVRVIAAALDAVRTEERAACVQRIPVLAQEFLERAVLSPDATTAIQAFVKMVTFVLPLCDEGTGTTEPKMAEPLDPAQFARLLAGMFPAG